jgi:hypothetical protein
MIDDADDPGPRQRSPLEDPAEHSRMDARILAAYRREFGGRRSRSASLRVPLPVAAAVLAALLVCATLVVRGRAGGGNATQPSAPPEAPVQVQVRHDAPLVTNTSLAGFEPVDEMQVIVVRGGKP